METLAGSEFMGGSCAAFDRGEGFGRPDAGRVCRSVKVLRATCVPEAWGRESISLAGVVDLGLD
jgi:hypothetical protein